MFIHNMYLAPNQTTIEQVVHLLSVEGVKAVCLIDEFGKGIVPFLKVCQKKEMDVSVAVPFEAFLEGKMGKKEGYFIATSYESYVKAQKQVMKLKTDFIPFLSTNELEALTDSSLYCFFKKDKDYQGHHLPYTISIHGIGSLNETSVENKTISVEEAFLYPKAVLFIEGISTKAEHFLREYEKETKCVSLADYAFKKEVMVH